MKDRTDSRNIFLIGFMGCGKSTVASRMQKQYGMQLIEMDREIAGNEGMPVSQIFAEKGEAYFRNLETELLESMTGKKGLIVSCGGGAAMREENVRLMRKSGKIVLLTASPETILERVKGSAGRPLLEGKKNIADITALMEARRSAYEAAADLTLATDGKSPDRICREIFSGLGY